jgi:hypothetical protein
MRSKSLRGETKHDVLPFLPAAVRRWVLTNLNPTSPPLQCTALQVQGTSDDSRAEQATQDRSEPGIRWNV